MATPIGTSAREPRAARRKVFLVLALARLPNGINQIIVNGQRERTALGGRGMSTRTMRRDR